MPAVKLSQEVRDILSRSRIEGDRVYLPQQLDRATYVAVDKVLKNAGGKWNRSAGAHVFKGDPATKLGLAIETGVSVDEKKTFQAFYTPPDLADFIVEQADVAGQKVLEPSAGGGALMDACRKHGVEWVVGMELNPEAAEQLESRGLNVAQGDFLAEPPNPTFDRVVMNPPFSKGQAVKHVLHAQKFLKPGGTLVAVIPNSEQVLYAISGDSGWEYRCWFELPEGSFKEAGTMVRTLLFKGRTKSRPLAN